MGAWWYTKKILEYKKSKVIAIDRDEQSEKISQKFKKKFKQRFFFQNIKFSQINSLDLKGEEIKSIIFDLGYSYVQIKDPQKGLSFDFEGDLNMKMGLNNFSAKDVIHKLDKKDLERIFKFFGEENQNKKSATTDKKFL